MFTPEIMMEVEMAAAHWMTMVRCCHLASRRISGSVYELPKQIYSRNAFNIRDNSRCN